jgi:hypothetical protein
MMREATKRAVTEGRGHPVNYTQANHDALLYSLAWNNAMTAAALHIIEELHARIVELESTAKSKGSLQYRGVFREGEEYPEGSFVTHHGSMWHANETTKDRPAEGSAGWTLCVKRGRDAKEHRHDAR